MSLNEFLIEIDKNQAEIKSHGKFNDDLLKKINYKFRLDWNYYSNRMEGGTLTKQETRSVMVGNISIKDKPIKDVMEMNGHDQVVLELLKLGRGEVRLSEKRIQDIHKAIMYEEDKTLQNEIGKWKSEPNEIINYKNEKILFTSPSEVSEKIHSLLDTTNGDLDAFFQGKKNKKHPLSIASNFHLNYISIHPFYDGNGRTARIFTNLILIACGFPVIVIKDEHKNSYYQYLADIQVYGGNSQLFYEFIGERILESQQLILDAIEGKEIDETDDLDKRIALLKKSVQTDDTVKEQKNKKTIYHVIKDIAFPLFEQIENKCKDLNELYMDYSKQISYVNQNNTIFQVGDKTSLWKIISANWVENTLKHDDLDVREIRFTYGLTGFKKHVNAFSCYTNIEFKFDTYNYSIIYNRNEAGKEIIKAYGEQLSPSERSMIINKVVGPLIDDTERYAQIK